MFFTQWPSVQAGYVRRMLGVGLRKTTFGSRYAIGRLGLVNTQGEVMSQNLRSP